MSKASLYAASVLVLAASALACSQNTPGTAAGKTDKASVQAGSLPVTQVHPQGASATSFAPFYVYQDKGSRNRYTASGYMPTGECLSIDDGWQYDVKQGKTCLRVVYDIACSKEGRKWIGVYWQNPADNWGSKKGGYNLTGATRLVFWAKGEMGGERLEEFRVGGLGANQMYADSDTTSIGPVILTKDWKEYTIDLRGKDLSYISGGFAWVANVDSNPHHCTFYLDDIRFE
jgi:hypothetical protein